MISSDHSRLGPWGTIAAGVLLFPTAVLAGMVTAIWSEATLSGVILVLLAIVTAIILAIQGERNRQVIAINVGIVFLFLGSQITISLPVLTKTLKLDSLVFVAVLLVGIAPMVARPRPVEKDAHPICGSNIWLLLFLLYAGICTSLNLTQVFKESIQFAFVLGIGYGLFALSQSSFTRNASIARTAGLLVALASLVSAYAIIEYALQSNDFLERVAGISYNSQFGTLVAYRAAATFANSNHFGGVLLLCLPLALANARIAIAARKRRLPWISSVGLLAVAAVLSMSRTIQAGLLIILAFYLLDWLVASGGKTQLLRWGSCVLIGLLVTLVLLLLTANARDFSIGNFLPRLGKLGQEGDIGYAYRARQFGLVSQSFVETKGLGLGLRRSRGIGGDAMGFGGGFAEETADNQYLTILSDFGVPGLLLFLGFFMATIRLGWKCIARAKARDERQAELIKALLCGQVVVMIGMIGQDFFYFQDVSRLLLIQAGMLLAACKEAQRCSEESIERVVAPASLPMPVGWDCRSS